MVNGKFVFPNVPLNSKIKVIGINFENGKPGMAVQQSVISKSRLILIISKASLFLNLKNC
jgi:hypothetical protein